MLIFRKQDILHEEPKPENDFPYKMLVISMGVSTQEMATSQFQVSDGLALFPSRERKGSFRDSLF